MRPIAVFRFSPTEGPAHFAEWLDRESLPWELVAIDADASVPTDARRYAGHCRSCCATPSLTTCR